MLGAASRAARPMGGAYGAPGHRAQHEVRGSNASKLTLAGYRQATIERSGLDKGSFHIRLVGLAFASLGATNTTLSSSERSVSTEAVEHV